MGIIINPTHWVYDLESYPNIFSASFRHALTGQRQRFAISEWENDYNDLVAFLYALHKTECTLVGYNNIGYDYPLLHWIIHSYNIEFSHYSEIFDESNRIIKTPWVNRYDNVIKGKAVAIQQLDLFKVHHFDNKNRGTSLKMLEFNMRSNDIRDLPYPPGTVLKYDESRNLLGYNDHDVDETYDFYIHSLAAIEFRAKLGPRYMNYSDVKIGKEYIIDKLEEAKPGSCYTWESGKREPIQTWRSSINLGDIVLPYIKFERPEFQIIHKWLMNKTVTKTKGVFNDEREILDLRNQLITMGITDLPTPIPDNITTTLDGFTFSFGLGGIHGSVSPQTVEADNDYVITDWDVTSYYPRVAIVNKMHPEHFDTSFCDIYSETYDERQKYKKGTTENAALKLALNGGGFGGAGDEYCPIYDPQYMLQITVNGQLLLCVLAEQLLKIPKLQIIQVNTDGVTVRCLRTQVARMNAVCKWWEQWTQLDLEKANYKRMFTRDVNNYIGEYEDGKLKRKGAYGHETPLDNPYTGERQWHKNHSALVVPMAAEAALVDGQCIEDYIINHKNIYDFMLRTKVNRSDNLLFNDKDELQRTTRYYISNDKNAGTLTKISPPAKKYIVGQWRRKNKLTDEYYHSVINEIRQSIQPGVELDTTYTPWDERVNSKNRSKYKMRETGLEVGYRVTVCNDINLARRETIDYSYYIAQTKKLVDPLRKIS